MAPAESEGGWACCLLCHRSFPQGLAGWGPPCSSSLSLKVSSLGLSFLSIFPGPSPPPPPPLSFLFEFLPGSYNHQKFFLREFLLWCNEASGVLGALGHWYDPQPGPGSSMCRGVAKKENKPKRRILIYLLAVPLPGVCKLLESKGFCMVHPGIFKTPNSRRHFGDPNAKTDCESETSMQSHRPGDSSSEGPPPSMSFASLGLPTVTHTSSSRPGSGVMLTSRVPNQVGGCC